MEVVEEVVDLDMGRGEDTVRVAVHMVEGMGLEVVTDPALDMVKGEVMVGMQMVDEVEVVVEAVVDTEAEAAPDIAMPTGLVVPMVEVMPVVEVAAVEEVVAAAMVAHGMDLVLATAQDTVVLDILESSGYGSGYKSFNPSYVVGEYL